MPSNLTGANQLNTGLLAGRSLEDLRASNQAKRAQTPAPYAVGVTPFHSTSPYNPSQAPAPMVVTSQAANQDINNKMNVVQQTSAQIEAQKQAQAAQKAAQATLPGQNQVSPATNSQGLTVQQMIAAGNSANPQQAVAQTQTNQGQLTPEQVASVQNAYLSGNAPVEGNGGVGPTITQKGAPGQSFALGGTQPQPTTQPPATGQPGAPGTTPVPGTGAPGASPTTPAPTGDPEYDRYVQQTNANAAALDRVNGEHQSLVNQMMQGTIPLTADQVTLMNGITQEFNQQIEDQKQQNLAYQAGITRAGIASGRNIYSPEQELSNVNAAISSGVRALSKINVDMVSAVTKANVAFKESNYKALNDAYDKMEQSIKDRQETIDKTHKAAMDALDEGRKKQAAALEQRKFDYQVEQDLKKPLIDADVKVKDYLYDQMKLHPDAGITAEDTVDSATAKIQNSPSWKVAQQQKAADLAKTQAETYKTLHPATKGTGTGSKTTITGNGDRSKLSPRAQAILDDPALLNNYTPTERGKIQDEILNAGFKMDAAEQTKLSQGQRDNIAKFDDILAEGNRALALVDQVNVGPLASREQEALAKINRASPNFIAYKSAISNMSSIVLNKLSGAAVSPSEAERLMGFIPSINDNEKTAKQKIALFNQALSASRTNYITRSTQSTSQVIKSNQPTGEIIEKGGKRYQDDGTGNFVEIK